MTALLRVARRDEERLELRVEAETIIPMKRGVFRFIVFRYADDFAKEHVALIAGDLPTAVRRDEVVLVRVHSECMTSEVFGSLKCDCAEQLDQAMNELAERASTTGEAGVLLYLRQEGRDIGLANKIRAYALQAAGADTVDANRMLRLPDDARRYDAAAAMLDHLGVRRVRLMTNNPAKVDGLRALGVDIVGRVPIVIAPQAHSHPYLATKRARMSHLLPRFRENRSATTREPIDRG